MNFMNDYGWGMGFGGFFMLLFWILVILGVVAVATWLVKGSANRETRDKSALDILQDRYARGEIDRKEYEHKRRDLQG